MGFGGMLLLAIIIVGISNLFSCSSCSNDEDKRLSRVDSISEEKRTSGFDGNIQSGRSDEIICRDAYTMSEAWNNNPSELCKTRRYWQENEGIERAVRDLQLRGLIR